MTSAPLCVMLEGAVTRSSPILEGLLRSLRRRPLDMLRAAAHGWHGLDGLRDWVWHESPPPVETLPVDARLIDWLRAEKTLGRRLILCTRLPIEFAQGVAARLKVFDEVLSLNGVAGTAVPLDAEVLAARFGAGGFDLAAGRRVDLPALRAARTAFLVGPLANRGTALGGTGIARSVAGERRSLAGTWLRALRVRQWAKNLLVFVPALAAHRIVDPLAALQSAAAFLFFGLCASGTYLVNDMLDLEHDRRHGSKRTRPLAAGELPIGGALLAAPLLVLAAVSGAGLVLSPLFCLCLLGYLVATAWYSLQLKARPLVDVMTLAALYTLRVLAGSAATGIAPSFWLLALSVFLFFSLAMVKRYTELRTSLLRGGSRAPGRGYATDDLVVLLTMGIASSFLAVLVLALYIDLGADPLYPHAHFLWLTCPLALYWVSRVWLKAHRGTLNDDPVVFALQDRPSLAVAALTALLAWLATRRELPALLP